MDWSNCGTENPAGREVLPGVHDCACCHRLRVRDAEPCRGQILWRVRVAARAQRGGLPGATSLAQATPLVTTTGPQL